MKNRYFHRSRFSEAVFRKFLRHVAADLTATKISQLNHINGFESFRANAKTRLARYRDVADATFAFHLQECEFRFNHRGQKQSLDSVLLKRCRENPLS